MNRLRRLTFLLRPQWLALYVVVLAFAYLCFTVLAPWQLGKNTKTSRENAQISSSPVGRTGTGDNRFTAAGFVGPRRPVASGHGDGPRPARIRGARPASPRRGRTGLRRGCWCRSRSTAGRRFW